MHAETIANALGGKKYGTGFMCRCPAHDDRSPSLSIKDADNGKILLHCFAGCTFEDVTCALRDMGLWEPLSNRKRKYTRQQYTRKQIEHAEMVVYMAHCEFKKGIVLSDDDQATVQKEYKILQGAGYV